MWFTRVCVKQLEGGGGGLRVGEGSNLRYGMESVFSNDWNIVILSPDSRLIPDDNG